MVSRRPNDLQEDQLIKKYLQRRVIITHVTTDDEGDFNFIRGVSFASWPAVRFECRGEADFIELYCDDVRWDFGPGFDDPRLEYLRRKIRRAVGKYDGDLDYTPCNFISWLELAMGCIAVMVICWGVVELFLKLVR